MDPAIQSSLGNESESNQFGFVTNQMANLQEPNGNFMASLRIRQNSRRSKSLCENAVEADAQMPGDLMAIERQPITGMNGHFQQPAAMIVASEFGHALPRPTMRATLTSRSPMQAAPVPRFPMRATSTPTSTLRSPRPIFQTRHFDEAKPRNAPVQKVRPLSVLPSLMQMPIQGSKIPNIATSAVFRQPQNWYRGPHLPTAGPFQNQNQNETPRFSGPVEACSYCRSSGERYHYGHTKKNCPKLASMSPCHRCGAIGISNHTDMYCPSNKTMLNLKRSEEEHHQFMSEIKKGRNID